MHVYGINPGIDDQGIPCWSDDVDQIPADLIKATISAADGRELGSRAVHALKMRAGSSGASGGIFTTFGPSMPTCKARCQPHFLLFFSLQECLLTTTGKKLIQK